MTDEYEQGALLALALAERFGCRRALLKERSPSCGAGEIYDGTSSHSRIPRRRRVAAEALRKAGLTLYGESRADDLPARGKRRDGRV